MRIGTQPRSTRAIAHEGYALENPVTRQGKADGMALDEVAYASGSGLLPPSPKLTEEAPVIGPHPLLDDAAAIVKPEDVR
jgi:hypothetical protein